jgi:hypothetical protein
MREYRKKKKSINSGFTLLGLEPRHVLGLWILPVSDLAIIFWSNSDSVLFFCFSFYCGGFTLIAYNLIGGVMVSVLATCVVDHGFES